METLLIALQNTDIGVLYALAEVWSVSTVKLASDEVAPTLTNAMLTPSRAEKVWDMLDDDARGALQMVLANKDRKMLKTQFELLYGKLEKMGRNQIEREKPHKQPKSVAQALYYRGLITEGFEKNKGGHIVPIVYIPSDFADVLPIHKTQYANLKDEVLSEGENLHSVANTPLEPLDDSDLDNIQLADTAIVDDMTTLLAYLRLHSAGVEGDSFLPSDAERILPAFLKPEIERLTFMLCVGVNAELIHVQDGRAYPRRDGSQKWLGLPRWSQIKHLADAWRTGDIYQELWHVSGLFPDPEAFAYDPLIARQSVLGFLASLPPKNPKAWWGVQDFIDTVKATEPHFQRPDGNYDSWYIRNAQNEYLRGFESWDAVEGALIESFLYAPLHWLGFTDVAEDAVRLNAYGRGFVGLAPFPQPNDSEEKVRVLPDATLTVSRKVSRADRYQVARFSEWQLGAEPYAYRITAKSLEMAQEQGITPAQIEAFLKRHTDALPAPVSRLLSLTQAGALAELTLERLIVLRTTSPEVLDRIYNEPSLRRYLGARLGEMAVTVRADTLEKFQEALTLAGLRAEFIG